jgi:hypothetical protein
MNLAQIYSSSLDMLRTKQGLFEGSHWFNLESLPRLLHQNNSRTLHARFSTVTSRSDKKNTRLILAPAGKERTGVHTSGTCLSRLAKTQGLKATLIRVVHGSSVGALHTWHSCTCERPKATGAVLFLADGRRANAAATRVSGSGTFAEPVPAQHTSARCSVRRRIQPSGFSWLFTVGVPLPITDQHTNVRHRKRRSASHEIVGFYSPLHMENFEIPAS